ncbi:hypothetical protein [Pararhizobium sp. IMCC21322]|uniref:hypothetical protein n=1 Tax=Pararhizobium sp. IMCC21322 TaxID=3067903 RepID=UPI002740C693|nr:hypothetical protein [Pararhizobium sp. IMCC21322]
MFVTLSPDPQLAPMVATYWFIEDIQGEFAGKNIHTSPIPLAVLSVNIGRPNTSEDGSLIPRASLLGQQSRARLWRSCPGTYFVMVMLTIPGLVRLFPNTGPESTDRILDLGAIAGDALAGSLSRGVSAAFEPGRIAKLLDHWLIARLASSEPVSELRRVSAARTILRCNGSVSDAAEAASVNRRQLHRWFLRHTASVQKNWLIWNGSKQFTKQSIETR